MLEKISSKERFLDFSDFSQKMQSFLNNLQVI